MMPGRVSESGGLSVVFRGVSGGCLKLGVSQHIGCKRLSVFFGRQDVSCVYTVSRWISSKLEESTQEMRALSSYRQHSQFCTL